MNFDQFTYIKDIRCFVKYCFPYASDDVYTWLCCQSALETGYGKSDVCLKNANLFGMRFPKVRPTLAIEERDGHSYYLSHRDSVCDYAIWFAYYGFVQSDFCDLDSFLVKFKLSPFNSSSTYVSLVDSIYKEFKKLLKNECKENSSSE